MGKETVTQMEISCLELEQHYTIEQIIIIALLWFLGVASLADLGMNHSCYFNLLNDEFDLGVVGEGKQWLKWFCFTL